MEQSTKIIFMYLLAVLFFAGISQPILAYVMSSTNYKIQSDDSLTPTGGGSSSVNYIFRDTMGEVSSGISNSSSYGIKAGFQEMQETSLSVSSPGDFNLTPSIPGVSGGTADADTHWTVQTDDAAGFDMKMNASSTPAMKLITDGTYFFDDYPATPTYHWSIGSSAAEFGFSVLPATANDAPAFEDNGSACGSGANVGNCWAGLSTAPATIIHRTIRTSSSGEDELITFKAQSNKLLENGSYVASLTITVASN